MKHTILLLILTAALSACNVNPSLHQGADGSITATSGGSIFSNAATEGGEVRLANGASMSYYRTLKDETKGVKDLSQGIILGKVAIHGIDATTSVKTGEQVTARAINNNATKVKLGKQAADVQKTQILNPVEVPAP